MSWSQLIRIYTVFKSGYVYICPQFDKDLKNTIRCVMKMHLPFNSLPSHWLNDCVIFYAFLSFADVFLKLLISEKFFQEYYQSGKQFIGHDQGPTCLQRLSADDTQYPLS